VLSAANAEQNIRAFSSPAGKEKGKGDSLFPVSLRAIIAHVVHSTKASVSLALVVRNCVVLDSMSSSACDWKEKLIISNNVHHACVCCSSCTTCDFPRHSRTNAYLRHASLESKMRDQPVLCVGNRHGFFFQGLRLTGSLT